MILHQSAPRISSPLPVASVSSNPVTRVSVVVPVKNWCRELEICLRALKRCENLFREIIVVFDGSVPLKAPLSDKFRYLPAAKTGPAGARNFGAQATSALSSILLFVDSDVVVNAAAIQRLLQPLSEDQNLSASMGSYDAFPSRRNYFSQYKNLLHRFYHQTANGPTNTFWSGFGAIRRSAFFEVGGFDRSYLSPSIEDIELGYRLTKKKHRIEIIAGAQVKHLKKWSFWSTVHTDIFFRAIPWARLLLGSVSTPKGNLNLSIWDKTRTAVAGSLLLALCFQNFPIALALGMIYVSLSLPVIFYFTQLRGYNFATKTILPQFLYSLYCGSVVIAVLLENFFLTSPLLIKRVKNLYSTPQSYIRIWSRSWNLP